jgi:aconitase A
MTVPAVARAQSSWVFLQLLRHHNYGEGSSVEHAMEPRFLGVKAALVNHLRVSTKQTLKTEGL